MCIKKLRRHLCKYFLVFSCIIISLFMFFNTKNNVTNADWLSWIRKFALLRFVARRPVHLRLLEDPYINSSGLSINCTALGRHNTTEIARFSFSIILFSLQIVSPIVLIEWFNHTADRDQYRQLYNGFKECIVNQDLTKGQDH